MKFMETCDLESDKGRFWQEHLAHWRSSGLTQSQYCRQQGLRWHTFHYWRKKLDGISGSKVGGSRLRLVPLNALEHPRETPDAAADPTRRLRIHIGPLVMDVEERIDIEVLKRLVNTLAEVAPCGK
jgi:hypothetical protein